MAVKGWNSWIVSNFETFLFIFFKNRNFLIHLFQKSRLSYSSFSKIKTQFNSVSTVARKKLCKLLLGPAAWCDKALPVFWSADARQQRWKQVWVSRCFYVFISSRFRIFPVYPSSICIRNLEIICSKICIESSACTLDTFFNWLTWQANPDKHWYSLRGNN